MMPSKEPVTFQTSLPFTRDEVPKTALDQNGGAGWEQELLTFIPRGNELKTVDHLRIETRGDLNSHASRIEQEVQES